MVDGGCVRSRETLEVLVGVKLVLFTSEPLHGPMFGLELLERFRGGHLDANLTGIH